MKKKAVLPACLDKKMMNKLDVLELEHVRIWANYTLRKCWYENKRKLQQEITKKEEEIVQLRSRNEKLDKLPENIDWHR